MSLSSRFVRFASRALSVAVLGWASASAQAADVVPPPPVVAAAPVAAGDPGCATCEHGAASGSCATCKHHVLLKKNKTPFQVNLCPGACFGYFQPQWRKWDDVCPYPYIGHGVGDAPRPAAPVINVPRPGGELSPPRPLPGTEKEKMEPKGSGLPPIPGGKFSP